MRLVASSIPHKLRPSAAAIDVPLLHLVNRGDPAGTDDACPLPTVAEACRGPTVRARDRHLPRGGEYERINWIIKDATVERYHYESHDQLRTHLADFMNASSFAQRLKTLSGFPTSTSPKSHFRQSPTRSIIDPIHQVPAQTSKRYPLWSPKTGKQSVNLPLGCALWAGVGGAIVIPYQYPSGLDFYEYRINIADRGESDDEEQDHDFKIQDTFGRELNGDG